MHISPQHLQPFFRDGRLQLPEQTINILLSVGLDWHVGHHARRGINLDDTASIAEIRRAVDVLLGQIDAKNPFYKALNCEETRFLLTGKPATT